MRCEYRRQGFGDGQDEGRSEWGARRGRPNYGGVAARQGDVDTFWPPRQPDRGG